MGWFLCVLLIFISQAGTIQDTGLWSDVAEHGIYWDAGVDSPGALVPDHCYSPQNWDLACPQGCALFHSLPSDCSKGQYISSCPEVEKCCIHRGSLSSSQPPRTAFKNYSGRKGETDNEEYKLQAFCREEKNDRCWDRGEQRVQEPTEIWGKQCQMP